MGIEGFENLSQVPQDHWARKLVEHVEQNRSELPEGVLIRLTVRQPDAEEAQHLPPEMGAVLTVEAGELELHDTLQLFGYIHDSVVHLMDAIRNQLTEGN
jgi:hypothetical protein